MSEKTSSSVPKKFSSRQYLTVPNYNSIIRTNYDLENEDECLKEHRKILQASIINTHFSKAIVNDKLIIRIILLYPLDKTLYDELIMNGYNVDVHMYYDSQLSTKPKYNIIITPKPTEYYTLFFPHKYSDEFYFSDLFI